MRAIVIVIADLYLEPELARSDASAPGIEYLARFGDTATHTEGWRAWTAHWLGLSRYAGAAPASVAAAALPEAPAGPVVWLATPLHLSAGMTSLHCDRRSILRLEHAELEALAASFRDTFHGSGFDLHPLTGGELLLSAPPLTAPARTTEPARMLLTSVAEALAVGEGAAILRRLGAEIEMWLHGHPLNDERMRRGAAPVATLWVWGGGAPATSSPTAAQEIPDAAFGSDAYVRGLWRLAGGETRPMPVDWAAMIREPRVQRALGVVEVAELLHANPSWPLAQAVAEIDRRLISPSLAALRRGEVERLVLLANNRSLTLRAGDRWRLWRRLRPVRTRYEGLV